MNKVAKAEILLTKRCNYRCDYCNMPQNPAPLELNAEAWGDIFMALTEELGCPFYAIYGAEPMLHPEIFTIITWLQNWGKAKYSLLTNGTILSTDKSSRQRLLDAGLESLTLSVDSLKDLQLDNSTSSRHEASGMVLAWALQHRDVIKDLQCTSTLHRQNMGGDVITLIEHLTDRDIWWSADIIHDNKAEQGCVLGYDPQYSKVSDYNTHYSFRASDAPELRVFLEQLLNMKQHGYKIYQSEQWWKSLIRDVDDLAVQRNWRCSAYPSWLTIDADGYLLVCDDFQVKSTVYAEDLPERFDEFTAFRADLVDGCRGCAWSTHWMAHHQLKAEDGVQQVTHGRKAK